MARHRLIPILALLPLLLAALTPLPLAAAEALDDRLAAWPDWSLPAPLERPGQRDLIWPDWFAGHWLVSSCPLEDLSLIHI